MRVASFSDGRSALAACRRQVPSLLILDGELEGLDGIALLRELRQHGPTQRLPCVLISVRAVLPLASAAWPAPIDRCLLCAGCRRIESRGAGAQPRTVADGTAARNAARPPGRVPAGTAPAAGPGAARTGPARRRALIPLSSRTLPHTCSRVPPRAFITEAHAALSVGAGRHLSVTFVFCCAKQDSVNNKFQCNGGLNAGARTTATARRNRADHC